MTHSNGTGTVSPGTDALRQLLAEHERDMAWLARKVGRDKSYIWRVVTGERPISVPLAESFAGLFGVPVETFLPREAA